MKIFNAYRVPVIFFSAALLVSPVALALECAGTLINKTDTKFHTVTQGEFKSLPLTVMSNSTSTFSYSASNNLLAFQILNDNNDTGLNIETTADAASCKLTITGNVKFSVQNNSSENITIIVESMMP